jgi:signal transduction histidine kinase
VKAPALAEAAIDLAWLSSCAESLAVLVRMPATLVWSQVRADPGMVLLLARHAGSKTSLVEALRDPALLARALHFFHLPAFVDWNQPHLLPIYETCVAQARLAHALACQVPDADPDHAWIGGLLAPLGWLAACAIDPETTAQTLQDPDLVANAAQVQQKTWGLEHSAIARRLCRRWGLPAWLSTIIGHLGLPVDIARNLGAEPNLFQVVQLAVSLVQERGQSLGLVVGSNISELMARLGLSADSLQAAWDQCVQKGPALGDNWQAPASISLLPEFLRLALESRNREDPSLLERLQSEVDLLQGALQDQCATEKERLDKLKLSAMGELAAGAGHEINNPLAVISGQAQYLASHETDPERSKALQTIIGQTRRIHVILNEMMQFARPPVPQPQLIDPRELIHDVAAGLGELAGRLQIQLLCPEPEPIVGRLVADPVQTRLIISCLLRNAIEAAPAEGWAGVRVQVVGDSVEFTVEDNGPGPTPAAREHMFDPFYSGRSAGRGRGLGLPTAWRLAQLNAGQLRFEDSNPGLTRFVCRFPLLPTLEGEADPSVAPFPGVNGCLVQEVIPEVA